MMDISARKLKVIEKVMQFDENAISKMESLIDKVEDDSISLEQYNREIEEADAAVESGDFIDHNEAVKKIRSWR